MSDASHPRPAEPPEDRPDPSEGDGPVTYRFRTSFPAARYLGVAVVLVFVLVAWDQAVSQGEPIGIAVLWATGGAGAVLLVGLLVWLLPGVGEGKLITVDDDGLRAGLRRLPAHRIGRIERIAPDDIVRATWSRHVAGRPVGRTAMFVHGEPAHAVLVRDREGGSRPWWLLEADDPHAFVAALQAAADRAAEER